MAADVPRRPYSAAAVANWFLVHASKLTPMKIQKLVYFAHGWELGLKDRPLINERVEAWPYGPVVPSLYHEFKKYGSGYITDPATTTVLDGSRVRLIAPAIPDGDRDAQKLLAKVLEVYGNRTGTQLSALTHVIGSPWKQTCEENPGAMGVDIPDERIKAWFKKQAERGDAAHAARPG